MMTPGLVVAIVGPTAVGKSVFAEELAVRLGTSVVSIDAMQVYRGMDIGTAKPGPLERRCPLLMVDVCDPNEDYSVQVFQREARTCIDGLLNEGKTPVLCGGTGLYLNAVIDEMDFPHGSKGDTRREELEELAEREGPLALHAQLERLDPRSAALIHPNNVRRTIRALELLGEGTTYATHHDHLHSRTPHYQAKIWGLTMNRENLYARIDARLDEMVEQGLIDEVRGLISSGLSLDSTAGQAIGYKEVFLALEGTISIEEATEQVKRRSRRYAKRQLSWFRRDRRVRWIDIEKTSFLDAVDIVLTDLRAGSNAEV